MVWSVCFGRDIIMIETISMHDYTVQLQAQVIPMKVSSGKSLLTTSTLYYNFIPLRISLLTLIVGSQTTY